MTIGIRHGRHARDAERIAEEHNRLEHPGWEIAQAITEFGANA
jgi:hypothetical protein